MTMHAPHDSSFSALLYDDCERCEEQAENPLWSLDEDNTAALWQKMLAVEKGDRADARTPRYYGSRTERKAGRKMYEVAVFLERYAPGVDPWVWPIAATAKPTGRVRNRS